jgi:hypothetical protein
MISLQQPRTDARRLDGRYGLVLETSNSAWSYYNALQLQYTQRMKRGLTLQAGHTWSKNIDTGSEATSVGTGDINAAVSEFQSARSLRANGRLAQPQRLTLSYIYEIPVFRDQKGPSGWDSFAAAVLGRVLGGWQVSGAMTFASGNPFTVMLGYDLNGDSIGGDRPFLLDPKVLGGSIDNARIDATTGRQFSQANVRITSFSPGAAAAASKQWPWYPGTDLVASLGRNTFWAQGQNNWDLAILKNIRLYGEHQHLQFRAEMFNLMNRVQFAMPAYVSVVDTGVSGWRLQPRFGEITSQYNSPRYMQMSLRFFF